MPIIYYKALSTTWHTTTSTPQQPYTNLTTYHQKEPTQQHNAFDGRWAVPKKDLLVPARVDASEFLVALDGHRGSECRLALVLR